MHELMSASMIAERSGHPSHRVKYVLLSRAIKPVKRVGNVRLFSEEQYERVVAELEDIAHGESLKNRRREEAVS